MVLSVPARKGGSTSEGECCDCEVEVEVEVGEEVEQIVFGGDLQGTLRCPTGGKFKTNFSSPNPSSCTFPHRLLTTP